MISNNNNVANNDKAGSMIIMGSPYTIPTPYPRKRAATQLSPKQ